MARPTKADIDLRARLAAERQSLLDDLRTAWRLCPATAHLHPNYQRTCHDCLGAGCAVLLARGLAEDGTALPWSERPDCGAKSRTGLSCKNKVIPGKHRCKLHGGSSTGPRTPEGKARISLAQSKRWAKLRAARNIKTGSQEN